LYIEVKGDAEEKENKTQAYNARKSKKARASLSPRKNATIKRSIFSSSPPVHQQQQI